MYLITEIDFEIYDIERWKEEELAIFHNSGISYKDLEEDYEDLEEDYEDLEEVLD